ncbi:Acyl-CoA reductase [Parafrankia irregularis]|uniref:Acyl-CoA reductase n=1 Tax=Parafrankia irregularis TaxID=795642 RepID=A0A0S4QM80_9ACTN|nr:MULTISPECIES: aldehyde dehydrogenase [Parafrankia]MBE3200136.1 aldehyde dehydrogenase [Parafrankia sp. CH37]CUU56672.1 Acyl-CoA reductase [Parafrankia irregularis]
MSVATGIEQHVKHPDQLYIGGQWVAPLSTALIDVVDSATEEVFLRVAEAGEADLDRAITAARSAFDDGPWPSLAHTERAAYLRRFAAELATRGEAITQLWPRESGALAMVAPHMAPMAAGVFEYYAGLADTYPFEEPVTPTMGSGFGLLVREAVGVVGAIIPWNVPLQLAVQKVAPALLAGCTVVLKAAPEAPGSAYVLAECAEAAGLPAGVFNVVTADRAVSERLVTDARVDKIAFTGSTAAGRRIASLCGQRIARFTLELGGKSAAVVLDDADLTKAATALAGAECFLTGQVCASLTRIVVPRGVHDEFVETLAQVFSQVVVGDPYDPATQMGPLAMARQRDRVEGYIRAGVDSGAKLVTGGGRPGHLERGYYIEPTVFGGVDNSSTIAQEEIFGPVLSVIPAADEADAIRIANDTIYGLNAAVFTEDVDRARAVAGRLRSGTVGHNAMRADTGIAFGGFKQSGIGREGGLEGLLPYLETKMILLDEAPARYREEAAH